jgi:hypothetical protein
MKRIRRLGKRRPAAKKQIKPISQEIVKQKKSKKRYRWDAILDRLPIGRPLLGAEIGVLNGRTACRLLHERPQLIHIMIDPWVVPLSDSSYAKQADTNATKPQSAHEKAYIVTKGRVAFAGKRAIIKRMLSHEAAMDVKDRSLDFVFIDGDHSYDGVKKDIELWFPKIKIGGWIGGHDLLHPNLPGVARAVYEAFAENKVEKDDNRTWFVRIYK